jgi:hypothetical protein
MFRTSRPLHRIASSLFLTLLTGLATAQDAPDPSREKARAFFPEMRRNDMAENNLYKVHPVLALEDVRIARYPKTQAVRHARNATFIQFREFGLTELDIWELVDRQGWLAVDDRLYRQEDDGHVSCYSRDGYSCLRQGDVRSADTAALRPVNCRADKAVWGDVSPYHTPFSWCTKVHAGLFTEWKNYRLLGFDRLLAFNPEGDRMCLSKNRWSCERTRNDDMDWYGPNSSRHPLICGLPLRAARGVTGYDTRGHWCRMPAIASIDSHPAGTEAAPEGLFEASTATTSRFHLMKMPSWRAKERPSWIAYLKVPRDKTLDMSIHLFGDRPSFQRGFLGTHFYSDVVDREPHLAPSGSSPHGAPFDKERRAGVDRDDEGKLTVAIRVGTDGDVHYHQSPGWNPKVLRAQFETTSERKIAKAQGRPFIPLEWSDEPGSVAADGTAAAAASHLLITFGARDGNVVDRSLTVDDVIMSKANRRLRWWAPLPAKKIDTAAATRAQPVHDDVAVDD